jgi:hypothetical protein
LLTLLGAVIFLAPLYAADHVLLRRGALSVFLEGVNDLSFDGKPSTLLLGDLLSNIQGLKLEMKRGYQRHKNPLEH